MAEDDLLHGVSGIDVKHIDHSVRADQCIYEGCSAAENQIEQGGICKAFPGAVRRRFPAKSNACHDACNYLQDMPEVGMDSQRQYRVVQPAGICKDGNTAKHPITHQKGEEGIAQPSSF